MPKPVPPRNQCTGWFAPAMFPPCSSPPWQLSDLIYLILFCFLVKNNNWHRLIWVWKWFHSPPPTVTFKWSWTILNAQIIPKCPFFYLLVWLILRLNQYLTCVFLRPRAIYHSSPHLNKSSSLYPTFTCQIWWHATWYCHRRTLVVRSTFTHRGYFKLLPFWPKPP